MNSITKRLNTTLSKDNANSNFHEEGLSEEKAIKLANSINCDYIFSDDDHSLEKFLSHFKF